MSDVRYFFVTLRSELKTIKKRKAKRNEDKL